VIAKRIADKYKAKLKQLDESDPSYDLQAISLLFDIESKATDDVGVPMAMRDYSRNTARRYEYLNVWRTDGTRVFRVAADTSKPSVHP